MGKRDRERLICDLLSGRCAVSAHRSAPAVPSNRRDENRRARV